jgi:formamidopyrimidine-DNA glycosylase
MDTAAHLTTHTEAELCALDLALGMRGLGTLLKNLEAHLGESVIFDPDGPVREQVLRDGIQFGRMLAEFLVTQATARGLGPEPVSDQWDKMVLQAIQHGITKD